MLLDTRDAPRAERPARALSPPGAAAAASPVDVAAPAAAPFLRVEGVSKRFGSQVVLRDITLDLAPDELVCLLGPSGCGKTTLLRILCGIEQADAGRLLQGGRDITRLPPAQRRFGVVFQSYALFPNLNASANVAYGLNGLDAAAQRKRVGEMLDLVGLAAHAGKYPAQLSGGQQQRVALARALAPQPSLLLLDEPLSALDAQVRISLRSEIRKLQQRLRMPTVMVTHDQDEAFAMADRVLLMHTGRIVQDAAPWPLYAQPADAFVARFVGRMNLWPTQTLATDQARVGALDLQLPAGTPVPTGRVLLGIRPEAVQVQALDWAAERAPQPPELPPNSVRAELRSLQFGGTHLILRWWVAQMQKEVEHHLVSPPQPGLPWRVGDVALLHLPAQALRLLPADAGCA